MVKNLAVIGLFLVSLSGIVSATEPDKINWINYKTSIINDNKDVKIGTIIYDYKFDDYSKKLFDTPFLVSFRMRDYYTKPELKAMAFNIQENYIIDCKNLRSALQFRRDTTNKTVDVKNGKIITKPVVETTTNFKATEMVPLKFWSSFSKNSNGSNGYEIICKQTKGYDENHSPTKDQLSGWQFFEGQDQPTYVNKLDLSNYDLNKPFKLRNKIFTETIIHHASDKRSTAYISEVWIDCKNKKYVEVKTTFLNNDFEYKPSLKPTVVHEDIHIKNVNNIPAAKWHDLKDGVLEELNICK